MAASARELIILEITDSSNNYAMAEIHAGNALDGMAWLALEQTQGKGRQQNIWKSEKGKNIMLSVAVQPGFLKVYQQFFLSVAAALACHDLLSTLAGSKVFIKWPNDLYIDDSKAGGILIENVIKGSNWQWSVIGIGLNINQTVFGAGLRNAVSVKQITGETFDIIGLATLLHGYVLERVKQILTTPFENLLREYNAALFKKDQAVRLRKANTVFETTIRRVDASGRLLTSDVIDRSFEFNEVSWIL